jgi:hypothetical protein
MRFVCKNFFCFYLFLVFPAQAFSQRQADPLPWQAQQVQQPRPPQGQQGQQQQQPRPPQGQQQARPQQGQQQQQIVSPVPRNGLTTEVSESWFLDVFRENGVVLWTRVRSGNPGFISQNATAQEWFQITWRAGAPDEPSVEIILPQQKLRGVRDFIRQNPEYALDVRITSNSGNGLALSRSLSFVGDSSVSLGSVPVVFNELLAMLTKRDEFSLLIELRTQDAEGRVNLVTRLELRLAGSVTIHSAREFIRITSQQQQSPQQSQQQPQQNIVR